jgi:ArsR family transcriptional regulator
LISLISRTTYKKNPSINVDGYRIILCVAVKELPVIRERGVCCALPRVDASWAEERAELMKALADPTRLTILSSLWKAGGPICICDFTASLDLSQPTISHHMAKLKDAGLVQSEKKGIWVYYRLRDKMPTETRKLLSGLVG